MIPAVVASAAMLPAGMPLTMMLPVVIAPDIRVKCQSPFCQCLNSLIRISGHSAVQLDSSLGQRHLRAGANAAADQRVHIQRAQHTCQGSVSAPVGIHHFTGHNPPVLNIVYLKLLGVSKVLENAPVLIRNCNSHR